MAFLRWLDANIEKWILIIAYSACAGIVFVEVVRRFLFNEQVAWSTTIPAFMFVWLTWLGASYAVKARAHLRFGELRERMPRGLQYMLLQLDYLFFLLVGTIVIYYSHGLLMTQIANESVVSGTDNVPVWIFYLATPVGWLLLLLRVVQCAVEDYLDLVNGRPIQLQGTLQGSGD